MHNTETDLRGVGGVGGVGGEHMQRKVPKLKVVVLHFSFTSKVT